jgi:hypothetical protein
MNTTSVLTTILLCAALASAACHGGGSETPAQPVTPSGDSFVLDAVHHTDDTSEPIAINGQELTFSEDPHAFDAVFQ